MILVINHTTKQPKFKTVLSLTMLRSPRTCQLSSESDITVKYHLDLFGFMEITLSKAQVLPSYVLRNAYKNTEKAFMDHARAVYVSKAPNSANIISSHTAYKV